jgi:hypothetical protein
MWSGYTSDGRRVERPARSIELYRAAPGGSQDGHSWTENVGVARVFLAVRGGGRHSPRQ